MIARLQAMLEPRLAGFGLSPPDLLARDAPAPLRAPGLFSANRACGIMPARDGWVALNLARADDRELVPVLTGKSGDPWRALAEAIAISDAQGFCQRAAELQLPVAVLGEAPSRGLEAVGGGAVPRRVVDMSALWAGPLCAALLQRAGAQVVRVDSLGRPDPTAIGSPALDRRINGGKQRVPLDLRTAAGRRALHDLLHEADAVVTSGRAAALARLGLEPAAFPHLAWVAITAHGFGGAGAHRVGFGDDCAVAGGLVRQGRRGPRFMGDALADPLTGLEAALAVLAGRRGLIDMAMARVAAAYAGALA